MLAELLGEVVPTGPMLGPQALCIRAAGQLLGESGHADRLGMISLATHRMTVFTVLFWLGPVTDPGNHKRTRELGIAKCEMQGGKAAHRQADDMSRTIGDRTHHISEVFGRADLTIGVRRFWHIGRRIAARAIGRAAKIAREETDLRVPAARIAGELVDEYKRRAAP